jgi:saccharopine dehydrogenase (NAD+, L-lysine-forming)
MNEPRILLLGGYGNTGRLLSRLLLQYTPARVVIAGRDEQKAASAAAGLAGEFGAGRATGIAADAGDSESLRAALAGAELVLVASSTARYARQVAAAALEAGLDYLDIQYSTRKNAELQSLRGQIEAAGRCFITDGGFHPGLPAALVRYAAPCFDRLEQAFVGSVIKEDWRSIDLPEDTAVEMAQEFSDFVSLVYRDGRWKNAPLGGVLAYRRMDFGREFGVQPCAAMFLEEMRSLPEEIPTLRETGFYVGGFNGFVDWIILPVGMLAMRISPGRAARPLARWLRWGLRTFSKPPYGTLLQLEARGMQAGRAKSMAMTLFHPDGYLFTAIPVAACLIQYLDGSIRKPGLWTQANLVEPGRLVADLQRMGIEVHIREQISSPGGKPAG